MKKADSLFLSGLLIFSLFTAGCIGENEQAQNITPSQEENEEVIMENLSEELRLKADERIDYNTGYQLRGIGTDGNLNNDPEDDNVGNFLLKQDGYRRQ